MNAMFDPGAALARLFTDGLVTAIAAPPLGEASMTATGYPDTLRATRTRHGSSPRAAGRR